MKATRIYTVLVTLLAVITMTCLAPSSTSAQNIATQTAAVKTRIDNNITNATLLNRVRHDSEGVNIKAVAQLAKNIYDSTRVLTLNVKPDGDFAAELNYEYTLPSTAGVTRSILINGVPVNGDKLVLVNWNTTGIWSLSGWTYVEYNGSDATQITNIGAYRLTYFGSLGKWVRD